MLLYIEKYGSSIKELYSIDRTSTALTESTLYQLRINSEREGAENAQDNFYILDNYIYVPKKVKSLSGLVLAIDQFELDNIDCECDDCESAWDKRFIAPDGQIEDIIEYTTQKLLQTKGIPSDEKPNLNENEK